MKILEELLTIQYWVLYQFKMIFPYWIAGVLAGSLISVFAAGKINDMAKRINHKKYGLFATIPVAMLGAASPICMYGTVPLIASLGRKGVPQYLLASFMVSSILINPNLFLVSFSLGMPLALTRLGCCIFAGILAGILVKLFFRERVLLDFDGFEEKKKCSSGAGGISRLLSDINRAIIKTAPYFLVGIILAALFEIYFPKEIIINMFGEDNPFGILLAASLGIPVYVCGGGTIPLLMVWMEHGMSPGSAMAFMITGPATKITNLSAVKILLGLRNFLLYIAFNIAFAIIAGIITDIVYGMMR